jgi:hypothetical protein
MHEILLQNFEEYALSCFLSNMINIKVQQKTGRIKEIKILKIIFL